MSDELEKLIDDASQGDRSAVESLLARCLPSLERFVRRHLGDAVKSKESASDLVQSVCRETLQRLASDRLSFRGESAFMHWLYQAAMNKILKRHRYYHAEKRDAGREADLPGDSSAAAELLPSIFSPSRVAMAREELERLQGVFEQLPPRYQEIIVLSRLEGLSRAEISERLGISETNSRVLLTRAIARMVSLADRL